MTEEVSGNILKRGLRPADFAPLTFSVPAAAGAEEDLSANDRRQIRSVAPPEVLSVDSGALFPHNKGSNKTQKERSA